MTQIDKLERARDALDKLDDFIQDGCSARPEDKTHALSGLETIRTALASRASVDVEALKRVLIDGMNEANEKFDNADVLYLFDYAADHAVKHLAAKFPELVGGRE